MARSNPYKPSFNAGEFSPRLWGRTDFQKYQAGCETCLNVIPLAEGGLMRRPGTRYVSELASSSVKGRLRKFKFSTTQAYMLEFGSGTIRFYRHQAQIVAENITGSIANGTFAANITSWTDKDTGGSAASSWNSAGYAQLLGDGTETAWLQQTVASITNNGNYSLKFRVIGAPGDKIYLRIGTSDGGTQIVNDRAFEVGYHVYTFTATATTIYLGFRNTVAKALGFDDVSFIDNAAINIDTPYAEADLYQITGPQSADVLYLFHASHPTYKLQRYGHDSWSLVQVAWQDGPWLDENTTATTLTFSAATGLGVTVTASAITGINNNEGFKTTDVGRLIRLTDGTVNWGWAVIVGWTSTTVVTADVKRSVVVTTAETKWRLGAWSGTTGYPSASTFYQQRLCAANTTDKPHSFWASQTADFENHAPDSPNSSSVWNGTVEDDDALDYTISADDVNAIRWMSAGKGTLAIGTVSGEWTVSSTGSVITPTDIVVDPATSHGSAQVEPLRVGNVVLFVQKGGRKVREFAFSFDVDGYVANDMTRLSEHITRGGVVEMAFAEEADSLVWAVREDGTLLSMTFRREEDVVGWARHIIGGAFGSGNAVVESVAVIPGADGAGQVKTSEHRDEVWMIVKRTIDGATKRYIEVMEGNFEGPLRDDYATEALWQAAMIAAQKDAYFADSVITYDGAAASTITGLSHIEGQTAKVLSDGAIHPDETVASGQITLDADAEVVQVGLGYAHRIKTLKFEGGTVAGTAVGKTKRVPGVTFVVMDSMTISFGPDADNLQDHDFREVADAMDNPVPLFSGEFFAELDDDWKTDPRIVIENDDPVPFTLLAMAPYGLDVRESR